jgi:hypothetical protein
LKKTAYYVEILSNRTVPFQELIRQPSTSSSGKGAVLAVINGSLVFEREWRLKVVGESQAVSSNVLAEGEQ